MPHHPPYYIVPEVERYKQLDPSSHEAKKLARRIAANIGDYASLRLVLGIDPPEFAKFYPDMEPNTPDTFDTIDTFLDKYGKTSAPIGYMATQENASTPEPEGEAAVTGDATPAESLKKLLSSHRYQEAIRLIESQNLNNPNKSIYFAHQMRFLRKLMALDKYRNITQG